MPLILLVIVQRYRFYGPGELTPEEGIVDVHPEPICDCSTTA